MMNVDNKDVSSLTSPCKMRDFSSYNLLFCVINNLKNLSVVICDSEEETIEIILASLDFKTATPKSLQTCSQVQSA